MSLGNEEEFRQQTRILRFLASGDADLEVSSQPGLYLLRCDERGQISATFSRVEFLIDRGAIERSGGRVLLTERGRAELQNNLRVDEPYRSQHMKLTTRYIKRDGQYEDVLINLDESPLASLGRRRNGKGQPFLAEAELLAGERFRGDYTRAQIMPRLGANWDINVASGGQRGVRNRTADMHEGAISARARVEKAIAAVGPELAAPLIDICCFLKGLGQVELERGWPARSAKLMLKTALAALSRHYHPTSTRKAVSPILHWGADDYKPKAGEI